ncbi:MAG: radical SAM protein [Candidatus Lernaella stagnicola]|nr:radical SAM protein [Candidatus Lernaella stagnicola]
MKALLVHPPNRHQVWAGVPQQVNSRGSHMFPPLQVMHLSAYVKARSSHACNVVDFRLDEPDETGMARRIAAAGPDLVGVTANSHNLANVAAVVRAARQGAPQAKIVLGGPHVNAFPESAASFPGVDAAVCGDGEKPLVALLDALADEEAWSSIPGVWRVRDGVVEHSEVAEPIHDLDDLPLPDRDWAPRGVYFTPAMRERQATTIIGSRGCPFQCIYCSVPHRYRARSAAHIVNELEECSRRYGIREVHFVDDIFNITEQRVIDIAEEILRRDVRMKWGFKGGCRNVSSEMLAVARRAGLVRAHYGVETYTDEGLRALDKKLTIADVRRTFALTHEAGVLTIAYMIIGSPHEKKMAELLDARRFIAELKPDYVVYSLFSPYPESPSFALGVERGLWPADVWERFMRNPTPDHDLPTTWTEHFTKHELVDAFKKVNFAFYAHPRTLVRTLGRIRSWVELKRTVAGGMSLLKVWLMRAAGGRRI